LLGGAALIGSYWTTGAVFNGVILVALFFVSGCFALYYPYCVELYYTKIRSTGLSMTEFVGGLANLAIAAVVAVSMKVHPNLPFAIFGVVCLVGGISILLIPYDTTGVELDTLKEIKEVKDVKDEKKTKE